ncbi:MAG: hypothetical protein KKB31_07180 [Nanoarchaeota archaeon]|nr:hypothetical protein [Nanoarchaeota archaeon]
MNKKIRKIHLGKKVNCKKSCSPCKLLSMLTLVLIFLIIQISTISSIGITPGRTSFNYEPNAHKEVSFSVVNTENKDMSVVLFVRGVLNGSVILNRAYDEFSSTDGSKSFVYSLTMPPSMGAPGLYETEIVALEMPRDLQSSGTFVGATVAVVTQLHVYVPYPDKYLEGKMEIISDDDGKTLFFLPVVNRGKLDIVSARATIEIYTALNEKVATVETDYTSVNSLQRAELIGEWIPNVHPGKYLAIATLIYDNEVSEIQKEFNVGEALIEIEELYVNDFSLGEIAKFNALVNNKWSNPIKDSYLNILVYNNDGQVMADFKSPNYNLGALSKSEMVAYWDTAGVHKGTYDGKLVLWYGVKSTEKNIELDISENKIGVSGITGRVLVRGKSEGLGTNTLIIILIGVLIFVNVIWFIIIKKFMRKKK